MTDDDTTTLDENTVHGIHCPKCQSDNWDCWDERVMDCWDKNGNHAGVEVAGGLRCKDCGNVWLDYSAMNEDPDCECDGWND